MSPRPFAASCRPESLSVVVPFHRNIGQLRACLSAVRVAEQRLAPELSTEIVLVADDATEDVDAIARDADARIVRLTGPQGPATARNRGASLASGDLLVFVDADVVIAPDALARLVALFATEQNLGAAFGAYDENPADSRFFSQCRNLSHSFIHQRSRREAHTFWAGLGAVRRPVFETVGGFDERFGRPCVEDIDLGYRIRAAGYRIVLDARIQCQHLKRWTLWSSLVCDLRDRGIPWTQLLGRYGARHNDLNITLEDRACVVASYLLVLSLGVGFWWWPIIATAPIIVVALWWLARPYYRFLIQLRGLPVTVRWFPFHVLHHLCNGASFAIGSILYLVRRWTGRALPGTLPLTPWGMPEAGTVLTGSSLVR